MRDPGTIACIVVGAIIAIVAGLVVLLGLFVCASDAAIGASVVMIGAILGVAALLTFALAFLAEILTTLKNR